MSIVLMVNVSQYFDRMLACSFEMFVFKSANFVPSFLMLGSEISTNDIMQGFLLLKHRHRNCADWTVRFHLRIFIETYKVRFQMPS